MTPATKVMITHRFGRDVEWPKKFENPNDFPSAVYDRLLWRLILRPCNSTFDRCPYIIKHPLPFEYDWQSPQDMQNVQYLSVFKRRLKLYYLYKLIHNVFQSISKIFYVAIYHFNHYHVLYFKYFCAYAYIYLYCKALWAKAGEELYTTK